MTRFKVGDKIIGNAKANRYGITCTGWKGVVSRVDGKDRLRVARTVEDYGWCVLSDCFDLVAPLFDPKKPVVQRCGKPAKITHKSKDHFRAEVKLPSGKRELTFGTDGYFYRGIESDFDLVNK